MSEHIWVIENLETHVADGLPADERNRIERHLSGCHECARELAEARELDQALTDLFAAARPAPGLESRMIETLRPARRVRRPWLRFVAGMAAVVLLGLIGFAVHRSGLGNLRMAGALRDEAYAEGNAHAAMGANFFDFTGMIHGTTDHGANSLEYPPALGLTVKGSDRVHTSLSGGIIGGKQKRLYGEKFGRDAITDGASNTTGLSDGLISSSQADTQKRLDELTAALQSTFESDGARPADGIYERKGPSGSVKEQGWQFATPRFQPGPVTATVEVNDFNNSLKKHVAGLRSASVTEGDKQRESVLPLDDSKSMDRKGSGVESPPPVSESAQQGETKKPLQDFAPAAKEALRKHGAFGEEREQGRLSELSMDSGKRPTYFDPNAKFQQNIFFPLGEGPGGDQKNEGKIAKRTQTSETKGEPKGGDRNKVQDADAYNKDAEAKVGGGEKKDPPPQPDPVPASRKIIRTGDVEFEIDQFDAGVAAVTKLINAIPGAFIATINSDKLANGKVKGSIVVRMPPERLDKFLLDLRQDFAKTGDLKNQRIASQDITKQYFDVESRLRAARTMEDRLIDIIKKGKGEIKDLLAAERELGVWRTKIEEMEGEIRYYNNQVSLSTLTIALTEKEIRQAASMVISERINMRIETEDVEKSLQTALAAVTGAKGRVLKSDLKLHAAGQYEAVLHFEVAPTAADKVRDQLKQLGIVTQHDSERQQQAVGGTETLGEIKSRQSDVQFNVVMYNIADIKPRDTFQLQVAAQDVPAEFRKLQAEAILAKGWVRVAQLNEQDKLDVSAQFDFDVPAKERDRIEKLLIGLGDVFARSTKQADPKETSTERKVGYQILLRSIAGIKPRETFVLAAVSADVPAAFRKLRDAVIQAKGQVRKSDLDQREERKPSAELEFDVPADGRDAVEKLLGEVGEVFSRTTNRVAANEVATGRKVGYKLSLRSVAGMEPRDTVNLLIEARDVDQAAARLKELVKEKGGTVLYAPVRQEPNGKVSAVLLLDVPLTAKNEVVQRFKGVGIVHQYDEKPNFQAPDTKLATAQLNVVLTSSIPIVPSDEGLWPQVRTSLGYSFRLLIWSLAFIILGLMVVLPWALILWVAVKLTKRWRTKSQAITP